MCLDCDSNAIENYNIIKQIPSSVKYVCQNVKYINIYLYPERDIKAIEICVLIVITMQQGSVIQKSEPQRRKTLPV